MTAAALFLAAALTLPTNVLVLRSGDRIDVASAKQIDARIVFRTLDGTLFSLPVDEIDVAATNGIQRENAFAGRSGASATSPKKLKVTAAERRRIIEELEQNHFGRPGPVAELPEVPPSKEQAAEHSEEEWSWRRRAKALEESVRQSKENRDLLIDRADSLRSRITGLIALGYKPGQFTYDTTQLAYALEQIPQAELEITRAERALAEFREEARRKGILPGWLR